MRPVDFLAVTFFGTREDEEYTNVSYQFGASGTLSIRKIDEDGDEINTHFAAGQWAEVYSRRDNS